MSDDVVSVLMEHLGPVTAVLDECVALSIASAERRCVGLDHLRYGFARSLMVRADLRENLEQRELPAGWQITGNSNQMGQLKLRKPGVVTLRFLRANPLQPGRVPHAGSNPSRQRTWRQEPLPYVLAGPHEEIRLLLLWGYVDIFDRLDGGFQLTVAHPLQPGKFGARVPCDLVADIPRGGTAFEELAGFRHDEEEDLFEIEIAEDSIE